MQASPRAAFKGGLSLLPGLALLFINGPALAVDISSISGTPGHDNVVTINGSGFGNRSRAEPLLWDNFEKGGLGAEIAGNNGWRNYAPDSWSGYGGPYYTDDKPYSGSQSARKDVQGLDGTTGDFHTAWWGGSDFNDAREVYASMYVWWNTVDGGSPNAGTHKWIRLNCNKVYSGDPSYAQQFQPDSWFYEYWNEGSSQTQETSANKPSRGAWHRMEVYWKLGNGDGILQSWVDLNSNLNKINISTDTGSDDVIYSLFLPMAVANTVKGETYYVDDVYINNTRARVEIGDAPKWSDSNKRELQIPSDWTDSSVTVTINEGSFDDLQNTYLYVVDADGNVNENGYPLSDAAASPKPPTNLQVR